jgi:predicted permease
MTIPLLQGRDVAWSDTPESQPVIVVSQRMAHTYWPDQDPIGKRIKLGRPGDQAPWVTVVGVVGNVQQVDLIKDARPAMYFPASQDHGTGDVVRDWVVKTSADAATLTASVPGAVWAVDRALPITLIRTMRQVRSEATAQEQFNAQLVAIVAVVALVLAAVGLYGVTAYSVAQRTRELGIRLALGAQPRDVLRIVLGQGARLVLIGLTIGTLASLALTRLMTTLLFGIGTRDPITFAGVGVLLAIVSLLACYIPARRAMRVEPVVALRS